MNGFKAAIDKDKIVWLRGPKNEYLFQGILLMYPGHDGYPPLYTLPRMYCHECIQSFYKWANVKRFTGKEMNSKEVPY